MSSDAEFEYDDYEGVSFDLLPALSYATLTSPVAGPLRASLTPAGPSSSVATPLQQSLPSLDSSILNGSFSTSHVRPVTRPITGNDVSQSTLRESVQPLTDTQPSTNSADASLSLPVIPSARPPPSARSATQPPVSRASRARLESIISQGLSDTSIQPSSSSSNHSPRTSSSSTNHSRRTFSSSEASERRRQMLVAALQNPPASSSSSTVAVPSLNQPTPLHPRQTPPRPNSVEKPKREYIEVSSDTENEPCLNSPRRKKARRSPTKTKTPSSSPSQSQQTRAILNAYEDALSCTICTDLYVAPNMIAACGHTFCGPCITAWLDRTPQGATCPTCRTNLKPHVPSTPQIAPNYGIQTVLDTHLDALAKSGVPGWELLDAALEQVVSNSGSLRRAWEKRKTEWVSAQTQGRAAVDQRPNVTMDHLRATLLEAANQLGRAPDAMQSLQAFVALLQNEGQADDDDGNDDDLDDSDDEYVGLL